MFPVSADMALVCQAKRATSGEPGLGGADVDELPLPVPRGDHLRGESRRRGSKGGP